MSNHINFEPGDSVTFGKKWCEEHNSPHLVGKTIMMTPQWFEEDNGLYAYDAVCPGMLNEGSDDPDSIYHLFGNDFERFMDCELVKGSPEDRAAYNKIIKDAQEAEMRCWEQIAEGGRGGLSNHIDPKMQEIIDRHAAAIKELQVEVKRWEKSYDNADKQYLKKEKEAAELRRKIKEKDATIKREYDLKHEAYNNLTRCHETMADNAEEIARLRKALEETRIAIGNAYEFGYLRETDEGDVQKMLDRINAALGEGDKDGN